MMSQRAKLNAGDAASTKDNKPSIVLIHPRALLRDCFARCLEVAYREHVVFSFESVIDWRGSPAAAALTPSISIIVIEGQDISCLSELKNSDDALKSVIVISDIDDADHILRTLKEGVRGYIPSNLPLKVVVEAVRLVQAGGVFVPASSFVIDSQASGADKSDVTITARQMAIIAEIRQGKVNKQIAYELDLSEHTVKAHLRNIMKKLNAQNRTQVAILSEKRSRSIP